MGCCFVATSKDIYDDVFQEQEQLMEQVFKVNFCHPCDATWGDRNSPCHGIGEHGPDADVEGRSTEPEAPEYCSKFYSLRHIVVARYEFLSRFHGKMVEFFAKTPYHKFVRRIEFSEPIGEVHEKITGRWSEVRMSTFVWFFQEGEYYELSLFPDRRAEVTRVAPHAIVDLL